MGSRRALPIGWWTGFAVLAGAALLAVNGAWIGAGLCAPAGLALTWLSAAWVRPQKLAHELGAGERRPWSEP
jgi:hypothetical protein